MKILGLSLLLICSFPLILRGETKSVLQSSKTAEEKSENSNAWMALPKSRPFPSLLSDPRDIRLGLRKNNKGEIEADVGGYRSLVGWQGELSGESTTFHSGLEGNAYFQMRQAGSKFPLHSSDGLIGAYAEAARGDWQFQLRFTHISAHLSDGLTPTRSSFVYTREFLAARLARQLGIWRVYAGYQLLVHTAPELPRHSAQLGGYAILPWRWGIAHPYFGGDIRIRSAEEGTTSQLGAGAAFLSHAGSPPVRLTASYLKGHDLRGQFFREPTEKWIFGLDLEI